jgi:hypothetical protein
MTPTDLLKIVGEVLDRFGCAVERSKSVAMIPIFLRHPSVGLVRTIDAVLA